MFHLFLSAHWGRIKSPGKNRTDRRAFGNGEIVPFRGSPCLIRSTGWCGYDEPQR
jgi:hypothetical protein